jgi:hypothetical protein
VKLSKTIVDEMEYRQKTMTWHGFRDWFRIAFPHLAGWPFDNRDGKVNYDTETQQQLDAERAD